MTDQELRRLAGSVVMAGFRGLTAKPDSDIHRQIRDLHLGGVILFDFDTPTGAPGRNIASPDQLRELATQLQSAADAPLLIAIDQEGGKVARLNPRNGHAEFASHAELGGRNDVSETRATSGQIAETLAGAGVNVNFAPVVDLNLNPQNPIVGALDRSFGADADTVTRHAREFIATHHDLGITCAIKHFPGHGSSTTDTHTDATDVTASFQPSELEPYRALIGEGVVDMVMVGHLTHKTYDANLPASLSEKMIDGLLRGQLGFDGVVVTDDMDMVACAKEHSLARRVALALNAGVDLLLFGNNLTYDAERPRQVVDAVVSAVRGGTVAPERLKHHAERVDRLRRRPGGRPSRQR